jgi:hypothetical protein
MPNEDKWCFAWFADEDFEQDPEEASIARAAAIIRAKWRQKANITISFLDGKPKIQNKVKAVAQEWLGPGMANLKFSFRKNNDTLIRISFKYEGSWSTIGTTCEQVSDKSQPTMNYGWLDENSPDDEVRRVVLHEFGHALGLIHEHQNPGGVIHWNRKNVIEDLSKPPNKWPLGVIEHNMFEPYKKKETNYTMLDPHSIMMYSIPARWTTDGFSVGLNTNLSDTDKKFIHRLYR